MLADAWAPLSSSPEGRTAYIQADLRDPAAILSDPVTREVLELQPARRADARRHPALHPRRVPGCSRPWLPCSTPCRRGAISDEHPLCLGYADPALNKAVHKAFKEADLFLVLGKRIDYRLALGGPRLFNPGPDSSRWTFIRKSWG